MGFAIIASGSSPGSTTSATTAGFDTTGADLIVAVMSYYANVPTLSDSYGNTWTALTAYVDNFVTVRLHYCVSTIVGPGHTFTVAGGAACYPVVSFLAASGAASPSPYDAESGAGSGGFVTSLQPGPITPATAGALLVTGITVDNSNSLAVGSGFSSAITNYGGGTHLGGGVGWLVQGAAAAIDPTWS